MFRDKRLVWKISLLMGVVSQLVYFVGYHQNVVEQGKIVTQKVSKAKKELSNLKEVSAVDNLEQELQEIRQRLYPNTTKIPLKSKDACSMMGLFKIVEQYPFKEVNVQEGEQVLISDEIGAVVEKKYVISYLSEGAISKRFIKNLMQSVQLIKVDSVTFRRCTTMETNKEVETIVKFSTFTRKS